jgi:hypothetical protein
MKMDSQLIGIIGKHILIANLIAADLEVAEPIRDHGVDLIVYRDGKKECEKGSRFEACPIQLKTSTDEAFEVYRKYECFPQLRIVYVWNVRNPKDAEFYCLTYLEAISVLKAMKGAQFSILEEKGHWVTTKPSKALKKILKKDFQVKVPKDWPNKFGMTKSSMTVSETEAS